MIRSHCHVTYSWRQTMNRSTRWHLMHSWQEPQVAKEEGLYGAGQDLLKDSFLRECKGNGSQE